MFEFGILTETKAGKRFWCIHKIYGFGVGEKLSKGTPTGLMRTLISLWYSKRRLAACSATSTHTTSRTAVFSEDDISAQQNFK